MSVDENKLNAFIEKAALDLSACYGGVMVTLGSRLGLYQAMQGAGPLNSQELAIKTGCAERYVREWLSSQAAGGYVEYYQESDRYFLTEEQALVLADEESPYLIAPAWNVPASMWLDEDQAVQAFKTGEGVPWGSHHERMYCGVSAFFRNAYKREVIPNWIPSLEGVVDMLHRGARVADVGCGYGHSTILMAQEFPNSEFIGIEPHNGSLEAANKNVKEAGVQESVSFEGATAQSYSTSDLDMICFFDCLHDMGDPIGAAKHARRALKDDGVIMLVEPFANDNLKDNMNPVGRLYYSASTTLCCAHAISEDPDGMALGAQAGEKRLREIFEEAGFSYFKRAYATDFNLIFEIRP
ncbi:MAG: class I SAM-dependent methyltransferase [Aestuariibacter sp.]